MLICLFVEEVELVFLFSIVCPAWQTRERRIVARFRSCKELMLIKCPFRATLMAATSDDYLSEPPTRTEIRAGRVSVPWRSLIVVVLLAARSD